MRARPKTYTASAMQNGIVVAQVSAPTYEQAEREILHYAAMYSLDGPVTVKLPRGRRLSVPAADANL